MASDAVTQYLQVMNMPDATRTLYEEMRRRCVSFVNHL